MKQCKIFVWAVGILMVCNPMNAQDVLSKKRIKEADPKVIGTRVVNKFIITPHTRFGNPRAEKLLIILLILMLVRGWEHCGLVKLSK